MLNQTQPILVLPPAILLTETFVGGHHEEKSIFKCVTRLRHCRMRVCSGAGTGLGLSRTGTPQRIKCSGQGDIHADRP